MTKADLLALAARVGAAADNCILAMVAMALGRYKMLDLVQAGGYLDAAASLVPEGWGWHVDFLLPQTPWASLVRGGVMRHDCHGSTPALALTAAALRAMAEEAPDA